MKTNTLDFIAYWFESLIIAIAMILVVAGNTAKAQNNFATMNNSVINGLFTPTAAQRFFEAGRENFAREARILENPEQYFDGDILKIDPEAIKAMKQNQSSVDLWKNHPPQKLNLDMYLNIDID